MREMGMDYLGPQPADFDNVRALNREFLVLLGESGQFGDLCHGLQAGFLVQIKGLGSLQRDRLASAPFLLFSLRESDSVFWDRLFDDSGSHDLFAGPLPDNGATRLIAASLAYLWQLARQNAYAARLVCGASLHWCEQIAERPLMDIIALAVRSDVLRLRTATDGDLWRKLLNNATSGERSVRDAACISALQRVLTVSTMRQGHRPLLAARPLRAPPLRVAEDTDR